MMCDRKTFQQQKP